MADNIDAPRKEQQADAASLRQALGEMRREAEREVARINLRLREQAQAPEDPAVSATERFALRQELDSLQQILSAKEAALESITEECRRLEDVLEDRNLVFDGLRKEVERRDSSLKVAQAEAERLRHALEDLRKQATESPSPALESTLAAPPARHPPASMRGWLIAGGLIIAVIAVGAWLLLGPNSPFAPAPMDASQSPALATQDLVPKTGDAMTATAESKDARLDAVSMEDMPPRLNDRLSDGSFGPTLARLPGGTFRMGHNLTTINDFGPAREVAIPPFLMGAYEVTFDEFDRFARATGRAAPDDYGWGRGTRPVVGVSWDDAQAYLSWLSRETGQVYRLPTEAEWEYAARAGARGSYWWGFGVEPGRAACFDCGSRWDNRSTAPVGSFDPSPFGLFDTAGNVMEWVADCYQSGYRGAPSDGSARLDGDCAYRVARGGAFSKPSPSMRVYVRDRFVSTSRLNLLGFRVARDP
ncbi:MAG: Sulphatase-modifying factor protein [Sphingobacteriia bacterium]|nr:Sulphatase-modifying factor protein [Sphingobacteriia bacterium]NCC38102.1 Sulphatase-modifying factor protein [Gammaproteobacteria bacterium]